MATPRIRTAGVLGFAAVTALTACGGDEDNPLCCNEFKVGATVSANIGGSAESKVAVQAVADFAAIAAASIDDITAACRSMAQDLDADKAEQDAAEAGGSSAAGAQPGTGDKRARMNAWCTLAVNTIASFKAAANIQITVKFDPPKCEASVSAKANCQAQCSGSAKCDLKANPPRCTGGKLQVSCKGGCTAEAGASVSCEGGCTGNCQGDCTAEGGVSVDCNGKCEGTCTTSGSARSSGMQADDSCQGQCQGTCKASATAPAVKCQGSCKGSCDAKCEAKAGASVKCDGTCDGEFEPLKCEGGKLEGGCQVEAKCDANCDASVSAKAECKPPALTIDISASADVEAAARLKATFEANLGVILAFKARLEAMADIAVGFTGNIGAVTDIKVACIPPLVAALATAVEDVSASVSATASVAGSIN